MLAANNCPWVTYDEETDSFEVNNPAVTKEALKNNKIQENMELVLLCVSIAAVTISLIFLTIIRATKSEVRFVHKNLLLALGLGNLVYVLDKTSFSSRNEHYAICSAVTIVQQYLHTAVFTWMLVEGILLYIKLVKVFTVNKQYLTYVMIGWGLPAIIIGLVAAIDPSTYDMGKTLYGDVMCGPLKLTAQIKRQRCWINGSLWIYKGPVLAILVVNLVVFLMLLRVVFGKIASKYGQNKINAARRGARSIVALLPLLGVTWLLGFFVEFHDAVKYVFIVVNSTQGVIFCIFHCVLDDQVRDALRVIKLPKKHQSVQKAARTPVSNPSTPLMEPNQRIDKFVFPEHGSGKSMMVITTTTQNEETKL